MSDAIPLSIIIVNTSHRELLRQCLAALRRAALPPGTETIVVDNASDDGSADMVAADFPEARLIRRTEKGGPAANYNAGFAVARGKYRLVLNEDAEVTEDALMRLYEHLEANPQVAIAAPRLTYPDGRPQPSCNRFPRFLSTVKRLLLRARFSSAWVRDQYDEEDRDEPFEPDWIMATSLMIRAAAMDQVGCYDEQFVVYYEEIDLARRLRSAGWTVAWRPDALVKHHHGVSNVTLRGERDITFLLLLCQSRYRYFHKHFSPPYAWCTRLTEAALFALFVAKVKLESAVPRRRDVARLKTQLYASLLRYALSGKGCPGLPR